MSKDHLLLRLVKYLHEAGGDQHTEFETYEYCPDDLCKEVDAILNPDNQPHSYMMSRSSWAWYAERGLR